MSDDRILQRLEQFDEDELRARMIDAWHILHKTHFTKDYGWSNVAVMDAARLLEGCWRA